MKRRRQQQQQKKLTSFFSGGPVSTGSDDTKLGTNKSVHLPSHQTNNKSRSSFSTASTPKTTTSKFGQCPMCNKSFAIIGSPMSPLERHASTCSGLETNPTSTSDAVEVQEQKEPLPGTLTPMTTRKQQEGGGDEDPCGKTQLHYQNSHGRNSQHHEANTDGTNGLGDSSTMKVSPPPGAPSPVLSFVCPSKPTPMISPPPPQQQQQQQQSSYSEPIPGLFLFEDFISPEEEQLIVEGLDYSDVVQWKLSTFNGISYGKRWGVHCNLRDRRVDAPTHPLPNFLQSTVITKIIQLYKSDKSKSNEGSTHCQANRCPPVLARLLAKHQFQPNEANAIDYHKRSNHWLKDHVDDRRLSKEPICNLSLCGDAVMTYRLMNDKKKQTLLNTKHAHGEGHHHRVLLKRRCLQIMTGPARFSYSHGITKDDILSDRRVSITIRQSPMTSSISNSSSGSRTGQNHQHQQQQHHRHDQKENPKNSISQYLK